MVAVPISSETNRVLDHWRDPDSSEAHPLDVIQLVDQALPGPTTVIIEIAACSRRAIRLSKAICQDLIDRLRPPSCRVETMSNTPKGEEYVQKAGKPRHDQ